MAYYEDIFTDQNSKTKCDLCKIYIGDSDSEIEHHLNNKEHTKLFMKRTMIENNIVLQSGRIVCGVCELVSESITVTEHIQTLQHKTSMQLIKSAILKDNGFLIAPEGITTQGSSVTCLVCDRSVELNLKAIKTHVVSERHKRAKSIAVQPLNAIFSVEDSKDDLWCKICQVYFENYIDVILEHVNEDPKHKKEIEKILALIKDQSINIEEFLEDPREDKAYCSKCSIKVPCNLDNLERHIKGKKHTS